MAENINEYWGDQPGYEWEPIYNCRCNDRGYILHVDARDVAWTLPCDGCERGVSFRKHAKEKRSHGAPKPARPGGEP